MFSLRFASLFATISRASTQVAATPYNRREASHSLKARGSEPAFLPDPDAPEACTFWYDHEGDATCDVIAVAFGVSVEDLQAWNPSLGSSCELEQEHSYCVNAPDTTTITTDSTTAAETTADEAPSPSESEQASPGEDDDEQDEHPTPTKPDNGIETPLPTQEGMIDNCNAFYVVEMNDSCDAVASEHGVTVPDIISWNPALGSACDNMWAGYNLCVSVIGYEPAPSNGVETPSPIQPGMVDNCDEFYQVESGDVCYSIAVENDINLDQFLEWNPDIRGAGCDGLWLDAYVCIGVID